jgi:hypothetical protein
MTPAPLASLNSGDPSDEAVCGGWRRWGPPDERSASEHGGGDRRQAPPREMLECKT